MTLDKKFIFKKAGTKKSQMVKARNSFEAKMKLDDRLGLKSEGFHIREIRDRKKRIRA